MHFSTSATLAVLALCAGPAAAQYDALRSRIGNKNPGVRPVECKPVPIAWPRDLRPCSSVPNSLSWDCPDLGIILRSSPWGLELKPGNAPLQVYVQCEYTPPKKYLCPASASAYIGEPNFCPKDKHPPVLVVGRQ
ncbi:hypothetical protein E4U42_005365 [Claviceps africana]|uniref:Uncharacterized protein n=1 Tax=Claviceps africana TaxID=83212 RepID=A0A8K0J4D0_9HYPO|nr:hypothetical protein E4U42_005365 [Claviceps africana]